MARFPMVLAAASLLAATSFASAAVQITEFCSNSGSGKYEFVEFTNTGTTAVNMSGWSEDDGTRVANKSGHSLSAFGTLQAGESAIFTEASVNDFKIYWWGSVAAAPANLKIIGPYTNDNLSSSGDEVNLYDSTATLVDRLTYGGSNGGPASGITRNAPAGYVVNSNLNTTFVDSQIGDVYGSFAAAGNSSLVGNPGTYTPVAAPEPATIGVLALSGLALIARRRKA